MVSAARRARKLLFLVGVSALTCGALVASAPDDEVHAQEAVQLRIATVAPEGTPWEKQLRSLKSHIEGASQGRIKVRMFMGGSLGGEKALVRRVSQGTLECFAGSTAALGSVVPELDVIESPYLFDSAAQADAALDGPALPLVRTALQEHGFQFGLWAENGFRSWFTVERQIRRPADMQGLRMRSQESGVHLATYRAYGATPVPIDVTNVLTSLQTGAVDGFDNTPLFAFATSWYQASHHLVLSQHSYQPGVVVWSRSWYEGLPADLRAVLDGIPASITTEGRTAVRRMDPILIANLRRAGVEVYELSASERAAFAQLGVPVQDRAAADAGTGGRALLRALRGH